MHIGKVAATLFGCLLIVSCSDPAADKSKAVTGEAASASPQAATQGQKYQITAQNSKIEFTASKVVGSESGSFKDFSGVIEFAGQPEKSRVNVTINMASVSTAEEGLTKHLQTPDFFDVAKFPQATYTSTEIKPGGERGLLRLLGRQVGDCAGKWGARETDTIALRTQQRGILGAQRL